MAAMRPSPCCRTLPDERPATWGTRIPSVSQPRP